MSKGRELPRGRRVDLPEWWLELANAGAAGTPRAALGLRLSEIAKRSPPWTKWSVDRFLRNDGATLEMAEAMASLLSLPPPVFIAADAAEALAFQAVRNRSKNLLAVADRALEEEEREAATLARRSAITGGDDRKASGGAARRNRDR